MPKSPRKPATSEGKRAKPKARAKSKKVIQFLQKPACSTCRKARTFLQNKGYDLHLRDLEENRLSVSELEKLIGSRDHEDFLNPRSEVYRKENMKENPPSRLKAIRLMAREPNLIRRPVIVAGGRVVVGFDKEGMVRL
jgi:Spx/MgsR family transcriptional regulator